MRMLRARNGIRLSTLAACVVLAACAVEPPKPRPSPAVVTARPEAPITVAPLAKTKAADEPWTSLAATFVMHDCANAALIQAKADLYTQSPARFEQLLKRSLPLMMYVQKHLHAAGIPGEFAMLPMLESSYDPGEPSRGGDAAGMWQMMPRTARQHGIEVNRNYDGRRDPVASTKAAIKMLTALQQRFGDWRLTDMAYNAGPYAVTRALRKHPDLGNAAIPDIPISAAGRKHLAKLMALACIVRDPRRFQVKLPKPGTNDDLAIAHVPAGTRLSSAAAMAGIRATALHALNPGYLGKTVPADSPRTLLLPAAAAESLVAALTVKASESVAQVDTSETIGAAVGAGDPPLPAGPGAPPESGDLGAASTPQTAHYRVRSGDTLWSIAHRHHVTVQQLEHWNHLHGDSVRAGETLQVHG